MLREISTRVKALLKKSVNRTPSVAVAEPSLPVPIEERFPSAKTDSHGQALVAVVESFTLQKSRLAEDILLAVRPNTRKAYASILRTYRRGGHDFPATPQQVANFLRNATDKNGKPLTPDTLASYAAALSFAHRIAGFEDPVKSVDVEMVLKAIRAQRGSEPERQAKPILQKDLKKMLESMHWQGTHVPIEDRRDAALFLLGWTAALRRSELVALEVDNLRFESRGLHITLMHSKNKDGSSGKAIFRGRGDICPVRAVEDWLKAAGIEEGRVFRSFDLQGNLRDSISGDGVGRIIQRRAKAAGLNMSEKQANGTRLLISGHSLRAGFITEMRKRRVPDWIIARMSGHGDLRMLDTYAREERDFVDNPSEGVW